MKFLKVKVLKFGLCLVGCCVLFCFATLNKNFSYISFYDLFDWAACKTICLVGNAGDFSADVINKSSNLVKTSNKSFVYFDSMENCQKLEDVDYAQLYLTLSEENVLNYLNKFGAKLVYSEVVDQENVFYFYLPLLSKHKFLNGKKTNLQLVATDSVCLVGYPMVYTAY